METIKLIFMIDKETYKEILKYCKEHGYDLNEFMVIALARLIWKCRKKKI